MDRLQELDSDLMDLVGTRLLEGSEQYGAFGFLGNDIFQYAYEELADLINYARMQYMKLRLVEEALRERGIDLSDLTVRQVRPPNTIPSAPATFTGAEEVFRVLSREEAERKLSDTG